MSQPNSITRRRFVAASLPTSVGLAMASEWTPTGVAADKWAPPLAVFSKLYQELRLDFAQSAQMTAEAGLDGVDCAVRPGGEISPEQAPDQMPRYAEVLRQHQVKMLLLTTGILNVDSPHAEAILRTAKSLGIRYYRLGYWYHAPGQPDEKTVAEVRAQLKDLAALNREVGVCGLFQNHSSGRDRSRRYVGGSTVELLGVVRDLDPDQIGVAYDLGHAIIVHGDDWRAPFEALKPHLRVAYVKDVRRPAEFVPFGQGELGRTDFFRQLARMNYRAPLSVHVEFEWARGVKTQPVLLQTLQDTRRTLRQWLGEATSWEPESTEDPKKHKSQ